MRNQITQNYILSSIYIADAAAIYLTHKTPMYCLTGAIIVMQLLSMVFPAAELSSEDEAEQKKIKLSKQIYTLALVIFAIAIFIRSY